jgi:hypothetical protein
VETRDLQRKLIARIAILTRTKQAGRGGPAGAPGGRAAAGVLQARLESRMSRGPVVTQAGSLSCRWRLTYRRLPSLLQGSRLVAGSFLEPGLLRAFGPEAGLETCGTWRCRAGGLSWRWRLTYRRLPSLLQGSRVVAGLFFGHESVRDLFAGPSAREQVWFRAKRKARQPAPRHTPAPARRRPRLAAASSGLDNFSEKPLDFFLHF